MKKLILLYCFCIGLVSCNSGIDGEDTATGIREFKIDVFPELNVNCNCDLTIIPSESVKVVVESHQNLIENLKLDSNKNRLNIYENAKVGKFSLYNVNVYFNPALSKIKLGEKTRMKISGTLKSEEMNIELNDKSRIDDAFVDINKLKLKLSDDSSVLMKGSCIDAVLESTDDSHANLFNMNTVNVSFKATGSSELDVYAMKDLKGEAKGNSILYYKGDPNKNATSKEKAIIEKK